MWINNRKMDYAAGEVLEVTMGVLSHRVTTGIYCNCCESKLTTAAVLSEGARCKLFKASYIPQAKCRFLMEYPFKLLLSQYFYRHTDCIFLL